MTENITTTVGWHLIQRTGKQCYVDPLLRPSLDALIWNCNKDWDFVIIITGDGQVRTGKSVFAMNIACYLASQLGTSFTLKDNVFFESTKMIDAAQTAPINTVFLYDEAREGLATSKRFSKIQQDLIDFFNECGQLNHIFILVLPDFFSLNWELATNRSEMLLNVFRKEEETERIFKDGEKRPTLVFERGFWELYNRSRKSNLYQMGKRTGLRNYNLVKRNCFGQFRNHYPIDEQEYRQLKKESLMRFSDRHKEIEKKPVRQSEQNKALLYLLECNKGKLPSIARAGEFNENIYTDLKARIKKIMGLEAEEASKSKIQDECYSKREEKEVDLTDNKAI
jgi:hypothetical protein